MPGGHLLFKYFFDIIKIMLDMEKEPGYGKMEDRVYEVGYILLPTFASEEVSSLSVNLKDIIVSFGGEFISDEMPKMIPLAYNMVKVISNVNHKFNTGYFGWIKFFMHPEKVPELKKKLDLDPNIVRFLILKTVKENTLALRRFVGRDSAYRRPSKKSENEEAVPINKEEIDKEIDAMVAV